MSARGKKNPVLCRYQNHPSVYTHLSREGENSRNWFRYRVSVFMFFEKFKNLPFKQPVFFCWFFHQNCWFFDVAEVPITKGSLILIFSSRTGNSGSLILKSLKHPNPLVT
jgi:hypothetical protein